MKIYLSSDHAGFKLKDQVILWVKALGHEPVDLGPFVYNEKDDYPDFIKLVAREVSSDPLNARGIIFGASGEGEAIVANRFPRVRAVAYYGGNREIIRLGRQHNDSNILSLGARFINDHEAEEMVKLWLNTDFSGEERHARRIKKIEEVTATSWFKKLWRVKKLFRRS